ncbi:MAG TPA: N-acetyltransferase [Longilinea sp.]|nr:N-acetyltransferase [Longilinea sp.]
MFAILSANLRDLNGLRKLEQECFGDDAWPLIDLITVLMLPGIVRLKAEVDGVFAGFVAGDPNTGEKVGWITTIGVAPEFRRMGIASALLETCEERMGMARVRLSVRKNNLPALAMYRSFGYIQHEVWPKYYQDGEDALVLERQYLPR